MKRIFFDALTFAYLLGLLLLAVLRPDEEVLHQSFTEAATVAAGLLALGLIGAALLARLGVSTLGGFLFRPSSSSTPAAAPVAWWRTFWGVQSALLFVLTFIASLSITDFSLRELTSRKGFEGAMRIFQAMAHSQLKILPIAVLAITQTIFMAFLATSLAVPASFLLGFLCARNIMGKTRLGFAVYSVLRALLNIIRSIEALIWAIIFSVWVGIGPFAGVLALMIHTIASLAKQYSEMIESIDEGPVEGILATGAGTLAVLRYAVVPQIVLPYLSFTIYRWDINVRMSTIIGMVGGGGIGTLLMQYQGQALWSEVGCLALVIVAAVWSMDLFSAYVREALK